MADDLETANATLAGLETLASELVNATQERNRTNAQDMYDALHRIIEECGEPKPNVKFIRRLAARAIQREIS